MSTTHIRTLLESLASLDQDPIEQLRNVLRERDNTPVRWHVDIPNHASNNNARRVAADFLEYDESKDTVTLQVGRADQRKWKHIYLLTYRLAECHVYPKDNYIDAVYSMNHSKPVYYKKEPNPNVKIGNPTGKRTLPPNPRPDPYEI